MDYFNDWVWESARSYSTADEMHFLDGLGTYIPRGYRASRQQGMSDRQYRTHLLQNYLTAAASRANWGRVDSAVVINYAQGLLSQAQHATR